MPRKRPVNWLFVALAVAAVIGAIVVLPRLGAIGWMGGVS